MRIEDYALIGDFRTAALVSRSGSIDWCCLPRFDSGACFAALLGTPENGFWQICPAGDYQVQRKYREGTLVLETTFTTGSGEVQLLDCMIPECNAPTIVRLLKGVRGSVLMKMELAVRFDYGSITPWVTKNPFGGIKAVAGPDALRLRSTKELIGKDMRTHSSFEVKEGESVPFVLNWALSTEAAPPEVERPAQAIADTEMWWQEWMSQCTYKGEYKTAVHRSLITLKSLIYQPTGGIIAAPTTSLPELIGGERNWDYRFCWLRDSTFTLYSLLNAGYRKEAIEWRDWLLRAVAGTPSAVNIMYGLSGERRLTETVLPWLPGYEGSRPVRTGNAAYEQVQHDIFGEVMDAFHLSRIAGIEHDQTSWRVQRKLVEFLESTWQKPDRSLWEVRGPARDFTHSKVMAWVAIDRAIKGVEDFGLHGPVDRWKKLAAEIHQEVCEKGFDPELGSFTQSYGSKSLDASLLMLPLVGFLRCTDPRIKGTVAAIEKRLIRSGFVIRYETEKTDDGVSGTEGAFLACTLWLADNLVLQKRNAEAKALFERVLAIRNDVGLLAEEYDPVLKRQLGNFPQAFSHIGLINTAHNLSQPQGPAHQRQASGLKSRA